MLNKFFVSVVFTVLFLVFGFSELAISQTSSSSTQGQENSKPVINESQREMAEYIGRRGLSSYELGGNGVSDIDDVLSALNKVKGDEVSAVFTFYTRNDSFKGSLLQQVGNYYAIVEYIRTSPNTMSVKRIHYILKSEIIAVTAEMM